MNTGRHQESTVKCGGCGAEPVFDTVQECAAASCANDVCCHCDGGVSRCWECRSVEGVDYTRLLRKGMPRPPHNAVWVAGRVSEERPKEWTLIGVFSTEVRADRACSQLHDFYAAVPLDAAHEGPDEVFPGAVWPRLVAAGADAPKPTGST